jgi:ribosomal protein S18 acetylase RimI-like enzyme
MRIEDTKKAATVTAQTMKDSWNRYEKDYYPKKALEFDLSLHTTENYVKLIQEANNFLFVAEEQGKIVGVAMGKMLRGHDKVGGLAFLTWLCVHPLKQRKGAGKALLSQVVEFCKTQKCHKITLYTLPVLIPALNLYFQTGFVPEAFLRKEWWKIDFIKMSLWLES